MRYYRVKPQYDNYKLSRDYEIFVGTELLTENDMGYCGYNPRTNRHFYIFVFMLRNAEIFKLQEVLQ